jgi:GTPase KRas protein
MFGTPEKPYKFVVLGAGAVGKSAVTLRMVSGEFRKEYDPTIEDSYSTSISVNNKVAFLEILDTAGQEQFATLQDHWIQDGKAFLLVYSINSARTFKHVETLWTKVQRNKEAAEEKYHVCLVGNKCDLPHDERQVPPEEGQALADKMGCKFFETSAKNDINIKECFEYLVTQIRIGQGEVDDTPEGGCCTLL